MSEERIRVLNVRESPRDPFFDPEKAIFRLCVCGRVSDRSIFVFFMARVFVVFFLCV